ncbi:hypothetical protein BCV72DRAFT_218642, partial [Rhizopus microsporus var. microsporus]
MDNITRTELSKINNKYWQFLDYNYPTKISEYKHREEIKNINNIQKIKQELVEKLGYTPVFFFLVVIFIRYDYKCPYVFLEKGLCILYHLISGNSIRDMNDYIPFTSFYAIYKEFWEKNKLNENDCIAFDGGYYYYIEKFIENCEKKGNDKININNFMFPIRKTKNIELNDKEKLYNETFGSFRSKIESCFGYLGNKFKRFNNNEGSVKVTDLKIYNLQLKLSLLLINIGKFCNYYNVEVKPNHILWINENFDYP